MKRLKILLLSLLLIPMNVLAYSDYIIPGWETLGIEINSDGIMVIGFYQIDGKFNKGDPVIKSGDYITEVNGIAIYESVWPNQAKSGEILISWSEKGSFSAPFVGAYKETALP